MPKQQPKETVVSCIIEKHPNEVLIARTPATDDAPAQWWFPSGTADPKQSVEESMRQFARNALGLEIDIHTGQPPFVADYHGQPALYRFFIATITTGEAQPLAFEEIRWILPGQLREYDFAPAHQPVIDWYLDK